MEKIGILIMLKLIGKVIDFKELQEDNSFKFYKGKVLSAIIEHDGNHKLCVEIGEDLADFFDVDRVYMDELDIEIQPL